MREEDICLLKFKRNIIDNKLCATIGKSLNQRDHSAASHHSYHLDKHLLLRKVINEARELSMKNRRCPFVLSFNPKTRHEQFGDKEHLCQVRPKKLSRDFALVRNLCEIRITNVTPTTFHECKGLFVKNGLKFYTEVQIQEAAAHTEIKTTRAYPAGHKPDYKDIGVVITEKMMGGKL